MKNQKLKIYKMFYLRKWWAKILTVVIYLNIFLVILLKYLNLSNDQCFITTLKYSWIHLQL